MTSHLNITKKNIFANILNKKFTLKVNQIKTKNFQKNMKKTIYKAF